MYKKLVSSKSEQPKQKWHKEINIGPDENITWKAAYEMAFKLTKNSNLIVNLHRRLATNAFLKKLGLVDDEACFFVRAREKASTTYFGNVEKQGYFGEAIFLGCSPAKLFLKKILCKLTLLWV